MWSCTTCTPYLNSFLKVFDKALCNRITEYLNTNNLLVGNRFGFRKGTATEDVILKLMTETLKALINKTLAGGIFCNLEKAFDSINHDILLSKLSYYGISDKANLYLNLIFRIDIKEFSLLTYFLTQTHFQNGPK